MEPPSVGSTTDEHGHSRPVSSCVSCGIVMKYIVYCCLSNMMSVFLGGVYAISSEWTIYYGRFGIKLLVHHGWAWLCGLRPYAQSINTKAQSYITYISGISVYPCVILHLLDIYADEVAVSNHRFNQSIG